MKKTFVYNDTLEVVLREGKRYDAYDAASDGIISRRALAYINRLDRMKVKRISIKDFIGFKLEPSNWEPVFNEDSISG